MDNSAKSKGLGRLCLTRAILQVAHAAEEIGIYALVLDAIDERAGQRYMNLDFGFRAFLDDPNHLYLPIETVRSACRSVGSTSRALYLAETEDCTC